jgi:CRP/FNR family cyclic AMP-dependent transcriptional regulator
MPKTRLFIGSSAASKSQAKAIIAQFTSPTLDFVPWWDGAFVAGNTLLENLEAIRTMVNGAVFVFAPEIPGVVRKLDQQLPNQNVLFEFGYFLGHFGRTKVCMLKYGDFYLPSDFGGYIHIFGSRFAKSGAVAQIGKRTIKEFTSWIQAF